MSPESGKFVFGVIAFHPTFISHYDKSLQEFFVLLKTKADSVHDWNQIRSDVTSRAFFLADRSSRRSGRRSAVPFSSMRSTRTILCLRPCYWSFS